MKPSWRHLWGGALGASVVLSSQAAAACLDEPPSPYQVIVDPGDNVPPSAPELSGDQVYRAERDSLCGHRASVRFEVTATDDKTPADEIGYLVQLVDRSSVVRGEFMPVRAIEGAVYAVFQDDGDEKDFEVDLWSIDRAGNVSESARRVSVHIDQNRVMNPDAGEQGCSATTSSQGGSMVLVVLGWQLRRRRRALRDMP